MKKILKSVIHYLGYEIQALPRPNRYALFEESDDRDYEQLRSFAARAARFSASAQQANAIRSLYHTGLLTDQSQTSYSRFEIGDENTLSLGVWRRESPGMQMPFIRDPRKDDEWFYWAKQERIEPKRARWRVVLLGESVARGYFYDPHFNPAGVLQTILESVLGPGKIDVVDLARSNLRIPELRACIGQSLALSPDLLVIFAGNNWHPHLSESDIPYVESLLRQQGVPGMKAYLDEKREQSARSLDKSSQWVAGAAQREDRLGYPGVQSTRLDGSVVGRAASSRRRQQALARVGYADEAGGSRWRLGVRAEVS